MRTADGKAMGPLNGEEVLASLGRGTKIVEVAGEGSQAWVPVDSVPAFAVASPGGPTAGPGDPLGWALVAIPAIGGAALALTGKRPPAPAVVSAAVVLLCAVIAAVDCRRRSLSATGIVAMLLLFVVGYPAYLRERAKWGHAPRLMWPGLLSPAIGAAGWVYGSEALATLSTRCSVRGTGTASCVFVNTGYLPGSECVHVRLARRDNPGERPSTDLICSGKIGGSESKTVTSDLDGSVLDACAPTGFEHGKSWTEVCDVLVESWR